MKKIRVGVIGLGYWGPNYVRNFIRHDQTEVVWGCDISDASLKKIHQSYPHVNLTKNYDDLITDKTLTCIAIATPPETHYKIARAALESGKHVLVAKPLATASAQAKELIRIAKKKNLLLHGDLTYLYTGTVKTIKNLLMKKMIGDPLYFDSTRTNLGLVQNEVNVIWDLAPHDLSIISSWFPFKPKRVFAVGSKHLKNSKTEEMAHITVNYSNGFIAHTHISWLSPVKIRTILVGGTRKMILFDDVQPDEKVKIYDKGVTLPKKSITPFKPVYRSGNVIIPSIDNEEALFVEIEDIVNQIIKGKVNYQNAKLNIDIIRLLEACNESLIKNRPINL